MKESLKEREREREKRVQIATQSWQRAGSDTSLYSLKEWLCATQIKWVISRKDIVILSSYLVEVTVSGRQYRKTTRERREKKKNLPGWRREEHRHQGSCSWESSGAKLNWAGLFLVRYQTFVWHPCAESKRIKVLCEQTRELTDDLHDLLDYV